MGKKEIKNAIIGNIRNVGSISIGDQVHYHISNDPKELKPLFDNQGLAILEINPKSNAGSHQLHGLYVKHIQAISLTIKNETNFPVDNFKIKVEIHKSLAKYDHNAEIINANRVFSTNYQNKLYTDDTVEINCGETYIHYKDAEEAFSSSIKVTVFSEFGKTEFIQPIDGFLFGITMHGERRLLTLSDFHDKNTEIG